MERRLGQHERDDDSPGSSRGVERDSIDTEVAVASPRPTPSTVQSDDVFRSHGVIDHLLPEVGRTSVAEPHCNGIEEDDLSEAGPGPSRTKQGSSQSKAPVLEGMRAPRIDKGQVPTFNDKHHEQSPSPCDPAEISEATPRRDPSETVAAAPQELASPQMQNDQAAVTARGPLPFASEVASSAHHRSPATPGTSINQQAEPEDTGVDPSNQTTTTTGTIERGMMSNVAQVAQVNDGALMEVLAHYTNHSGSDTGQSQFVDFLMSTVKARTFNVQEKDKAQAEFVKHESETIEREERVARHRKESNRLQAEAQKLKAEQKLHDDAILEHEETREVRDQEFEKRRARFKASEAKLALDIPDDSSS